MSTFINIIDVTINQYFIYRLSFVLWRFRNFLNLLLIYFLWSGVFVGKSQIFSYTQTQLISYILIVNITGAVVLSTRTHEVAGEILSGDIINYLLKPLGYSTYLLAKELADKFLNIIFSMGELLILLVLFHPTLAIVATPQTGALFFIFLVVGLILSFHLSLLLSLVAFWTPEVWAPRFIYMVFVTFLAGNFFPLDILPKQLFEFFMFTPFPYLIYIPSKILIHGTGTNVGSMLLIALSWCLILHFMVRVVWNKGMKEFSFFGR
ncbi:MAG: hypothetical protein RI947_187 [Candidatus Parcubacteria bacterium]